ncbi:MAG: homocysteine S-methyltransferase family protein [Defluviitaleaceae bacterium]|nr:homocysteine S-methyltransferase family protein [Defluviitaleaceae bacterium]
MDFRQKLNNGLLFFDGGMGTLLQRYGMGVGEASDMQNLINGQAVVDIHRQYIKAGADILTGNTLGAYALHYDNADEIIQAAVSHMKEAMKLEQVNCFMALDMGPTGKLIEPYGDLPFEDCYNAFLQAAQVGKKCGVDLILIETMIDLIEMKAAVQAAKTTGLPVIATMTFDQNGKTMMGEGLQTMVDLLESLEADALGMNCGYGPELYVALLSQLTEMTKLPILVQPNAGLPQLVDGKTVYDMSPKDFAQSMAKMKDKAMMLGGCCGTTPDHIKEMVALCRC